MKDKQKLTLYGVIFLIVLCAAMFLREVLLPKTAEELAPTDYSGLLQISELMVKNRATVTDENGRFGDYIELENISGETVDLEGWSLSEEDGAAEWGFPAMSIEPGEMLLLFCGGGTELSPDFSLSQGDTIYLADPAGQAQSAVYCSTGDPGVALELGDDREYHETRWATPGYPNTRQGYIDFCAAGAPMSPVVINEVMSANSLYAIQPGMDGEDWVELKNISDRPVNLSGWHLSDKYNNYTLWALPERTLLPGELLLIYCSGSEENSAEGYIHASFSINAVEETLYLSDGTGALKDYVHLHDMPSNGSMGRQDGENGYFYFESPSPLQDNCDGLRFVSRQPQALTGDGVYDGVESLSVELISPGVIYYTTDGTLPTVESPLYTEPINVESTTVIRAAALEEGGMLSPVATYSYIVNENHSLPVLSVVVDDLNDFNYIYGIGRKNYDIPANAALYDGESSFNHRCSVSIKGWTSLEQPKKSLGLDFKGIYGGDLFCDVFGNGVTQYSSLSVRAGQDYPLSIFRNELFEELALEMGDSGVYTQYSKFCVLYINGEYRGIYCLKEDFSRQYYASRTGVSKDSVTTYRTPVAMGTDFFNEVVRAAWDTDLGDDENYEAISRIIDIDSLVDWFIIEGYSANTDIKGNARVFRSTENGNKWVFAAYDFDWAFYYSGSDFTMFLLPNLPNAGNQIAPLIRNLLQNQDFRQRVLTRFAELNKTVLSNRHVIEKIDGLEALLEPEVARERALWGGSVEKWHEQVELLRRFILDNDWENHNIYQLKRFLYVTDDETAELFGK